ncbi:hypothetical protein DEO72_LG2g4496 [Vigna unguiculata]|uniref:Uncharacterized protein n=1 Tax=Vigna unguiculata TaxID=3917 RepID=A0A4D6L6P1_VIGUN|nr:hypothetical protein DEO72_LG2g4496 [Vigna unguiculata]
MGSLCEKWIIVGFVIAISFSGIMMEGTLAARDLVEIPNLPNPSSLAPSPLQPLPFVVLPCDVLGCLTSSVSTTGAP